MTGTKGHERSRRWAWWVCAILLAASLLNYANRVALTQNSKQVQDAFHTKKEGYSQVTSAFSTGFAIGGLSFGILADIISVRLLYPAVVIAWSLAGLSSGFVGELYELQISQFFLGLFEAGHWPCALRTTQRILKPHERTLGNSILQSGASLGSVFTPILILILYQWDPEQWRLVFFIVGGVGLPWALFWLASVRETDLRRPVIQSDDVSSGVGAERELQEVPFLHVFRTRRWWVLCWVVVSINLLWHYIRVWLPDTLQAHRYSAEFVQTFTAVYYLATFVGSLIAGWLCAALVNAGWNVFRARLGVFLVCGLLSSCCIPAAFLAAGPLLLTLLLLVGFGSLGLFPIYYSLNQEISAKHQGKVGGALGFIAWTTFALVNLAVGWLLDRHPDSRPYLFAGVGLGPLLAFVALRLFWGKRVEQAKQAT